MRAACLRIGNLVHQTDLGRDTRIPRPTVHRYLNLLALGTGPPAAPGRRGGGRSRVFYASAGADHGCAPPKHSVLHRQSRSKSHSDVELETQ